MIVEFVLSCSGDVFNVCVSGTTEFAFRTNRSDRLSEDNFSADAFIVWEVRQLVQKVRLVCSFECLCIRGDAFHSSLTSRFSSCKIAVFVLFFGGRVKETAENRTHCGSDNKNL